MAQPIGHQADPALDPGAGRPESAPLKAPTAVRAALTMTIFAAGIGASVLLIAAHDRPFVGDIAVGPGPLLGVMPERASGRDGG